ncbi:DUF5362 domain-containing protein [Bacillus sp. YC2]|uniref:DUF5362 family protein n=1 Tax=Bacillus sp. YC2 TaxID=2861287 RepID=UPI001CA6F386|nr:DUF5362 family protein [Bacillus sp. YC2]MBY8911689.1 DUF5362 domain-containing protein [Bacillus sp. YC2]
MKPESVNRSLVTISKWGKATGILFIIMGAFAALSGAFFFLIGAIPGVLQIIAGIFLMRSAKEAGQMAEQFNELSEENMLDHYAKFVKMQGIYLIVSIGISVIAVILVIIFMMLGIVDGVFNDFDTNTY